MVFWRGQVSINGDVSYYVYILMYAISFTPQSTMKVNIHNRCSDFKLRYRGSLVSCSCCNKRLDKDIDTGNMMNADLLPKLAAFEGAVVYELERKHVKFGNRPEATHILFLMGWKTEGYKKFRVFVHLIKCDEQYYWRKIQPGEYYQKCANQLCTYTSPIKDTWLMPDGTVLMTEFELDFTLRDGILNMTISKGVYDDHTKRPEWINLER
jgi:hypothetical protein